VGDKDAEDILDFGGRVGARVVEESVAVIVGVRAEVVGVFLSVLAGGLLKMVGEGESAPLRC